MDEDPTTILPWLDYMPAQPLHGAKELQGTGKQVIDVLPASVLRVHGARSIGYGTVLRHAPVAVSWADLRAAVLDAAARSAGSP